MGLSYYPVRASEGGYAYEFMSIGIKGEIVKQVRFTEINPGLFNLGFGDRSPDASIDDLAITDNGDVALVLATVVGIVQTFLELNPSAIIYAEGSTSARTRLYQMGITRYGLWQHRDIAIFGNAGGEWAAFTPGKTYTALAAARRISFIS